MITVKDKRIWLSLAGIAILFLALTKAVDDVSSRYTEDALVRALLTYGVARALNGVISVAQGTEVAIEPAGIGVIFTPGQILDPVNDLIERFSWVMLASSASLGILKLLLAMSVWEWFNLALYVSLIGALLLIWFKQMWGRWITGLIVRFALVLVVLRFAAPVIAIGNEVIYQEFLEPRYQTAVVQLEETTGRINEINQQLQQDKQAKTSTEKSFLQKAKDLYQSARQSIDIDAQIEKYEQAASDVSRLVIDLIVIFLFQTILLPIVFLWLVWHIIRVLIFRSCNYRLPLPGLHGGEGE